MFMVTVRKGTSLQVAKVVTVFRDEGVVGPQDPLVILSHHQVSGPKSLLRRMWMTCLCPRSAGCRRASPAPGGPLPWCSSFLGITTSVEM